MIQVIPAERRSAVLTPSSLACLAHIPTVNLTAGCAHECRYCYARGYQSYPGDGKVRFYTNTLAKLREELRRKRKKPATVYFSPSSDPFQPVPEVRNATYDVFKFLLESDIGVGVSIEARLDPILPGVTDGKECLEPLCAALAETGVRKIAASVLFLRPAVVGSLRRHVKDQAMLKRLLDRFANAKPLAIHAENSRVRALPTEARLEIMERLKSIAHRHGLEVLVCACKNPDISRVSCHISGRWPSVARRSRGQLGLFQPQSLYRGGGTPWKSAGS